MGGTCNIVERREGPTRAEQDISTLRVVEKMKVEDDVVDLLNSSVEDP